MGSHPPSLCKLALSIVFLGFASKYPGPMITLAAGILSFAGAISGAAWVVVDAEGSGNSLSKLRGTL